MKKNKMKTTLGGDRLGSGNKQEISLKNYSRSTHNLGSIWRSTMSAGTLVPFMNLVGLPGDSFDIDLECEVLTLPTIGPLFGSFKVQLDVFQVPMRLYNAALHMNKLGIGNNMKEVLLPRLIVLALEKDEADPLDDNAQINPSCLLKYLGISGIGNITNYVGGIGGRYFNGMPFLGYWDIYKNYYANKQEERGYVIHIDSSTVLARQAIISAKLYKVAITGDIFAGNLLDTEQDQVGDEKRKIVVEFGQDAIEPSYTDILLTVDAVDVAISTVFTSGAIWNDEAKTWTMTIQSDIQPQETWEIKSQNPAAKNIITQYIPSLVEFPLENIDKMREKVLQAPTDFAFDIRNSGLTPYTYTGTSVVSGGETKGLSLEYSQELLAIKTYQSDLFNNWINTEWLDGANGVNAVSAVDTTGDSFTIDALNLAQKVYMMLNRVALSGGTYDDWLDAVYTHERTKSLESPVYHGSLIKELGFEEVISNADTEVEDNAQPLGTLAGRGRLGGKHKGGKINIKIHEPSYIMGIVSLTPRIDYSQGNEWDVNLQTMDDFHKPALDGIGFQELITEQMAWQSTDVSWNGSEATLTTRSVGKQPAWINYMTAVNKTYGNFAIETQEMFMTLNRRYNINTDGSIKDLTTYIDPTKYNQIFAQTSLDAQNFWVQIKKDVIARRKMSAKVIPNL